MAGVSIKNFTRRGHPPRATFRAIAKRVLPRWEISLVFVGSGKARELNARLRGKTYVPNVLSYEAGKKNGEIVICLQEATRQARTYGMEAGGFVLYLFIHGLLHLKGEAHGVTMERRERKLVAQFAMGDSRTFTTHGTTNSHWHRHRHVPGKNGRRRRAHK